MERLPLNLNPELKLHSYYVFKNIFKSAQFPMILTRKKFDFADKCLIEKLTIQTPFRYAAIFPNEGCFLHFRNGKISLSSAEHQLSVDPSQSILLQCGNHFADLVHNTTGTIEVIAVHLFPDLLKEIFINEIPKSVAANPIKKLNPTIDNTTVINHFIQSLEFYFENSALVTNDILILKIKELILLLLQTNHAATLSGLIHHLFSPRKTALKEIIQTHMFSNLSLDELAKLCGLSLSTFKREFRELYNDSPANFIQTKRLEEAQKLLQYSEYSISEVCYQVGFNDVSNFTKAFKKHTNLTPQIYRQKIRGEK